MREEEFLQRCVTVLLHSNFHHPLVISNMASSFANGLWGWFMILSVFQMFCWRYFCCYCCITWWYSMSSGTSHRGSLTAIPVLGVQRSSRVTVDNCYREHALFELISVLAFKSLYVSFELVTVWSLRFLSANERHLNLSQHLASLFFLTLDISHVTGIQEKSKSKPQLEDCTLPLSTKSHSFTDEPEIKPISVPDYPLQSATRRDRLNRELELVKQKKKMLALKAWSASPSPSQAISPDFVLGMSVNPDSIR